MCRGKRVCSELGEDSLAWDRHAPLRTPGWMSHEVDLFVSAVEDLIAGNKTSCLEKVKSIRADEITDWYIEHGQMSGKHRNLILGVTPTPTINVTDRDSLRSPASLQNAVFERDGYRCRYCGNRLISQAFLRLFISYLDSDIFKRGRTNLETHGIIHITWPVADHVVPWTKGGRTNLQNLVSCCASCNYGKDSYTIEQLGLNNPFDKVPILDSWAGLTDRTVLLK